MDFRTLRRKNSNWQDDDDNPRKRTLSFVESFQAQSPSHYEDESDSDGIVNQLYSSITQFCQDVLFNLQNSEEARRKDPMSTPLYRLLDDIYTSFVTWGSDLDVRRGALDKALEDSRELRQFTIKILIRVCEAIENEIHPTMLDIFRETQLESPIQRLETKLERIRSIKAEASLHAQNSADSEYDDGIKSASSSDGYGPGTPSDSSSLEEALETLKYEVEALIELTPSLEDPIQDTIVDTHEKAAAPQAQGSSHEDCKYLTFLDGIKQKSPQCNDALATAIGKAIYRTTIRLQAERDAAANPQLSLGVGRPEKAASELFPRDSGYDTATRDPSQRLNNLPAQSTTSLGSGRETDYARTLNAYKDDDGTISTPFPSQPKELKIGDKFACVACGRQVAKSQSGAAWRRHVLSDLQPWICCQISCDCNFKSFSTRDEWLKHLQAIHEAHPSWNARSCPFCPREVTVGHQNMICHVERHLRQLSLAALPASHEDGSEDSESESEKDTAGAEPETIEIMGGSTQPTKPAGNTASVGRLETHLWDHPVYKNATQEADGLWHCPWEGEGYCQHKPSVLKADHDKFIEYHLKSLWCKSDGCPSNNNQPFATQEILYLHELKHHGMHKGGGRFLCTSPGCGRSRQGNGFMNTWLQLEHIKNVHDNLPDIGLPEGP
ncbi:hypothetical protein QBC37DRAFT_427857 [Rhypophila decipiens]|uniref:C2H2-domain containing protein second zinc finger domain-containing protein n=1 Tax=Rhypophila decipiens TaxID=261697 RepID=A0AAN7B7J4_9PEZI|nr:hypothetical protein QBC37DRAFT_427857 [Rhypophila decipiens]